MLLLVLLLMLVLVLMNLFRFWQANHCVKDAKRSSLVCFTVWLVALVKGYLGCMNHEGLSLFFLAHWPLHLLQAFTLAFFSSLHSLDLLAQPIRRLLLADFFGFLSLLS